MLCSRSSPPSSPRSSPTAWACWRAWPSTWWDRSSTCRLACVRASTSTSSRSSPSRRGVRSWRRHATRMCCPSATRRPPCVGSTSRRRSIPWGPSSASSSRRSSSSRTSTPRRRRSARRWRRRRLLGSSTTSCSGYACRMWGSARLPRLCGCSFCGSIRSFPPSPRSGSVWGAWRRRDCSPSCR